MTKTTTKNTHALATALAAMIVMLEEPTAKLLEGLRIVLESDIGSDVHDAAMLELRALMLADWAHGWRSVANEERLRRVRAELLTLLPSAPIARGFEAWTRADHPFDRRAAVETILDAMTEDDRAMLAEFVADEAAHEVADLMGADARRAA